MVMTTKTSNDSMGNSIDISLKSFKTSYSNESASKLYKMDDDRTTYRNDDFKGVLNSKTNSKEQEETRTVDDVNKKDVQTENTQELPEKTNEANDTDNIDELKEKLDELEEKSKTSSKDDASDELAELLALLAQLGIKEDNIKVDGKINSDMLKNIEGKINPDMLKNIIDGINSGKGSNVDLNSIMKNIMELLKNDSVKSKLDTSSLKSIENILNNFSSKLVNDNTEAAKETKSNIKSLMSEISNMLNDSPQDQGKKVLTLEDMLRKNYSQNSGSSQQENNGSNTFNKNETNDVSTEKNSLSKEDKFLNSLIQDKDNTSDKINLFASRSTVIQNQGVNTTVRGLTINKATLVDDLIKDVKFMSNNSLKELTVKVNPGDLGEITIKLVQEDGLMKANLKANSKETTALLSQNLNEIKKQLSEQNMKVSDVNIDLYQDDTTFFKDQGFKDGFTGEQNNQNARSQHNVSTNKITSNDSLDENLAIENNNVNLFA